MGLIIKTFCEELSFSFFLWSLFNNSHLNGLSVVSLFFSVSCLLSSGFSLFSKLVFSDFFLFHLVNSFNQDRLVLEKVTFWCEIEMVIDILGDLLGFSILSKESSKNSLSSHPNNFNWHSCVSCTLSFTSSCVSTYYFNLIFRIYFFLITYLFF